MDTNLRARALSTEEVKRPPWGVAQI